MPLAPPRSLALPLLACGVLLGGLACRDADVYHPGERRPVVERDAGAWRITYNVGEDRAPTWSAGSDSVYYAGEGYAGLPPVGGVLLAVPRGGGPAAPLVPEQVESRRDRWFTTPATTDGGIAYVEVVRLNDPLPCYSETTCSLEDWRVPPLRLLGVRVRPEGTAQPLPDQPDLLIEVEGRTSDGATPPFIESLYHPFQTDFQRRGVLVFRPTWSPDGSRVVFSDGLRLLSWPVAGPAPVVIAGTEDGVSAAWSPDGEWIAYTRLERGEATVEDCPYITGIALVCTERRIVHEILGRTVALVRPDGSGFRVVTDGEEPAWAPDGGSLYVRREDGIWRVPVEGGAAERVPGTEDGREPAVSPDGRFLAFTRLTSAANHDVWVVPLP